MTATPFIQGGDGGRYSGIVTKTNDKRRDQERSIYVGGDNLGDDGCVWIQIGTNCLDLGTTDPNANQGEAVVYMSLDDAKGLAIELLNRIRKVSEEMSED